MATTDDADKLTTTRDERIGQAVTLRVRVGQRDVHYGPRLAAGAFILQLFGDVATELSLRSDGEEGLMRAYEAVEFLAPVQQGDFVECRGEIVECGNSSRLIEFEARRSASHTNGSAGIGPPELVATARGTVVIEHRRRAS